MKFLFRLDVSTEIGSGHYYRCLNLAKELKSRGHSVDFVLRELKGMVDLKACSSIGVGLHLLPKPKIVKPYQEGCLSVPVDQDVQEFGVIAKAISPDWIVVDHYGIDEVWEKPFFLKGFKILTITELFFNPHYCNLIVDPGLHDAVPSNLKKSNVQAVLSGPTYALINPSFRKKRQEFTLKKNSEGDQESYKAGLSLGAYDQKEFIFGFLERLKTAEISHSVEIEIWETLDETYNQKLKKRVQNFNAKKIKVQLISRTAEPWNALLTYDFFIGACGLSQWERACLGLPTFLVVTAENQRDTAGELVKRNVVFELGSVEEPKVSNFIDFFGRSRHFIKRQFAQAFENGRALVDGCGVERIADAVDNYEISN